MKLLLINSNVEDFEAFVAATNDATEVILINPGDTYDSILGKKKENEYESVGIVDYNYNTDFYKLVDSEGDIFTEEGLGGFIDFIKGINSPIVDFMACSVFSDSKWQGIFSKIEEAGINCRSSNDLTGNLSQGGDWILESEDTPVNVAEIYFTSLIENYSKLLDNTEYIGFYGSKNSIVETDDYTIYIYGYFDNNSFFQSPFAFYYKKFKKIWITGYGSSIVANYGYWLTDSNGNVFDNITIVSGAGRFLAFKSGNYTYIFNPTINVYPVLVKDGLNGSALLNVTKITNNTRAFVLTTNDGLYAIGESGSGGINSAIYATKVRLENGTTGPFLTDVGKIYTTNSSFTVKGNSGIYAWGASTTGGINPGFATQVRRQNGTTGPFLTDVEEIYSNDSVFAAKGATGVYVWGNSTNGGLNTTYAVEITIQTDGVYPITNIDKIYSNSSAFAFKNDSGVYTWGNPSAGGINAGSASKIRLENGTTGPFLTDIGEIYPSFNAFTVKGNSGVYAWGNSSFGGITSVFATQVRIDDGTTGPFLTDVNLMAANERGFIANGPSGAYIWGSITGWSTSFARNVLDPTGTSPITGITDVKQARFNTFFIKANNINYISTTTNQNATSLDGYTQTVGSSNNEIFYNNIELANSFNNKITGLAKPKNANDVTDIVLTNGATAFKTPSGIFARGLRNSGGFSYYNVTASKVRIANQFIGDFLQGNLYSNKFDTAVSNAAFAVKGSSGIYVWGNSTNGGIDNRFATQVRLENGTTGPFLTDVEEIYSTASAFAAKGASGVYVLGVSTSGGATTAYATQLRLQNGTTGPFLTDVQDIYSNSSAFAAKGASGVYVWGNAGNGGIASGFATQVRLQNGTTGPFLTDVQDIYSNSSAFAAKGASGVYAWGISFGGGINATYATQVRLQNGTTGPFLTDVQDIYSNSSAFAAKGTSGVYVWGDSGSGGITTTYATQVRLQNGTTGPFLTDVQEIYNNNSAFAAKGASGIYVWGQVANGGINATIVTQLRIDNGITGPFLTGVQEIYSNNRAFAAKGASGIYVWGQIESGGINTVIATQLRLDNGTTGPFLTDVQKIASNNDSFAALGDNGNVYVWGSNLNGGIAAGYATQLRINDVASGPFLTGVEDIYGLNNYFIAKTSTEYYGWGNTVNVGFAAGFATLIPIADYDIIEAPEQIENIDIKLDSSTVTVSQLLTQAGSSAEGIAITKATNWRYKPSSSSSWKTIEDVSDENGLLLLNDAELEYIAGAKADPTLDFKVWNGQIGDEEDYLNTNIEYFNLVSDNTATVTPKTEPSDDSTLRIIMIAIIVAIAIVVLYFVIYYVWKYFSSKPASNNYNYRYL